jgi:hypothetical protein
MTGVIGEINSLNGLGLNANPSNLNAREEPNKCTYFRQHCSISIALAMRAVLLTQVMTAPTVMTASASNIMLI